MKIYLKDVFGFAKHQEKATYVLGYKLTLTRNSDNAVLNKADATNLGKVEINAIEWYVPHYTASMSQQAFLSNQIANGIPTERQYIERSVFMKEVNTLEYRIRNTGVYKRPYFDNNMFSTTR